MKNLLASSLALFLLSGCAGYHLGSVQPHYLREVHSLAVPTFKNATLVPRVEVLVTDTVIKELQADGTYRIASGDEGADATLKGEVVRVVRSPARSVRGNVLATVEFNLTAVVRFTVTGRDGVQLTSGEVAGATSFFVSTDVTTDERQALPLAAEQVAKQLVSQVAEGW